MQFYDYLLQNARDFTIIYHKMRAILLFLNVNWVWFYDYLS